MAGAWAQRLRRLPTAARGTARAAAAAWSGPRWSARIGSWRSALAVVTGNGWAVLLGVAAGLALTRWAGWVEAGVVVVIGAVCLLAAVASVIGRSWYAVDVVLPHTRTVVGQPAVGELRVRNTRERRVRAGVLELPVGAGVPQFVVPALPGDGEWAEAFTVPARRRGVVVLGPPRSVRGDALGLLRRVRQWADPVRLLVHPLTIRVPFDATGFQSDVEGVTTARLSSSDVSFHALREYAPGDDRRHVHWPTTARTGRLTVRQFEETRRSHHLIVLDTDAASWSGEDFELAVSVAASLAAGGLANNRRVSLSSSSEWLSTASPTRMLDALTELAVAPAGPGALSQRIREAVAARPATSVLTVICGPATPDDDIVRWPRLTGVDIKVGAVRIRVDSPPARSALGSVRVADCPALDALPRLVNGWRR